MVDNISKEYLRPWSPATYRIEVEGQLEKSWEDGFFGMKIVARKRADQSIITSLTGRVRDQSELTGMLDLLSELHLPILSVVNLDESNDPS